MRKIIVLIMFLSFTLTNYAQKVLTPEILWSFARIGGLKASPDGKLILYSVATTSVSENKSKSKWYMRDVATGATNQVADMDDAVSGARFRPDGKKIGYMSRKSGTLQIWEMDVDGKNKMAISEFKEGFGGFVYSPTGTKICYIKDVSLDKKDPKLYEGLDKTTGMVYDELNYRHWDTWNDGSYQHIFVNDVSNGKIVSSEKDILGTEKYDAPVKPFGGEEQITWTNDGQSIIYISKKETGTKYAYSTNSDIYVYNTTNQITTNITSENLGYDQDPLVSPDGKKIAYLSMKTPGYESDKNRIMVYDIATKKVEEATATYDNSTDNFTWGLDGQNIYFLSANMGTKQAFKYNLKTKAISQITTGDWDYNALEVVKKGKSEMLVGSRVNFSNPPELYEIDPIKMIQVKITSVNEEAQKTMSYGKVEKRMIKTHDGKDMLTWIIYPPNFDASKKYPVLLYCQGGPQSVVSQFFSTRWNFQLMAASGYIVVAPNRRGLPSFGTAWNDAIVGDYGGAPMQDYLSAIDNVSKEPFADKNKMGAVGASFGGYSVYWLAGNHNKRFKCFISHCGMFNMESWYGSTEEMFFAKNDQKQPYWETPKPFADFSPHKYVKNWDAPILVIHNEKDFRVPLTQGLEAFTVAQTKGIPSRFLYFPDENHWVLKPQNSVLWTRVFMDWLDKNLKN